MSEVKAGVLFSLVALRKESVDRNARKIRPVAPDISSLSARRAWIEMQISVSTVVGVLVALRKESVDRNYIIKITGTAPRRSLSARRAWIEILIMLPETLNFTVALRKESVDRNSSSLSCADKVSCRSPQGERG